MEIDTSALTKEQLLYIDQYKKINSRLEALMSQMSIIQNETKALIEELEDLRKKETKQYKNGKK